MASIDIRKIATALVRAGCLRDWDRTLRAANHPGTTRYNYLVAAAYLGRFLADE